MAKGGEREEGERRRRRGWYVSFDLDLVGREMDVFLVCLLLVSWELQVVHFLLIPQSLK